MPPLSRFAFACILFISWRDGYRLRSESTADGSYIQEVNSKKFLCRDADQPLQVGFYDSCWRKKTGPKTYIPHEKGRWLVYKDKVIYTQDMTKCIHRDGEDWQGYGGYDLLLGDVILGHSGTTAKPGCVHFSPWTNLFDNSGHKKLVVDFSKAYLNKKWNDTRAILWPTPEGDSYFYLKPETHPLSNND
eukprot:TRINITY_DN15124_c0_g1_i1.p1 TRINITY_DN15124_c0_g1~~TRINITY_DN15124_c0_g1_i1.p1  ORF type:complete len:189 (-),score=1.68 TRINITY_DN15124_c0_g1_i1:158-724(-)